MKLSTDRVGWVEVIREAAKCLTGRARRLFQAKMCSKYANESPRVAESLFGWNRKAVERGIDEQPPDCSKVAPTSQTDTTSHRGRPRVEDQCPDILRVTKQLLDGKTQADPKFQTTKLFTRITGISLRESLASTLGIPIHKIPSSRTLQRVMNRNGHSLRRLRKTLPLKKIKETNAIFANVQEAHQRASNDPSILRISIDNKAKVKLGPYDRGGKTRDHSEVEAADHDMGGESTTPCGILEVNSAQLFIRFVQGTCTADTTADHLDAWWTSRKHLYPQVRRIMINLDNGTEVSSSRRQFMKRLIEFSDHQRIEIELVYYPPYHSKYNLIERSWGILECHWNGTQLKTLADALAWAASMTWKQIAPIVESIEKVYSKGITMSKSAFKELSKRLCRTVGIEKWSLCIFPDPLVASS